MSNINKTMNKVKKALTVKGIMPLINQEQYYKEGEQRTKYIVHYGNPRKETDVVAVVYGKVNLLKVLIKILKAGGADG